VEPDVQAEEEGEGGAGDDGVAVQFEEGAVGGGGEGGEAEEEAAEDEGCVDYCGCDDGGGDARVSSLSD